MTAFRPPMSEAALSAASAERLREMVRTQWHQLAERDEKITALSAESDALEVLVSGLERLRVAVDDVLGPEYGRRGWRYTPGTVEPGSAVAVAAISPPDAATNI